MVNGKMLGRLGWRGQCSCCNGPKDAKAIRQEEKRSWKRSAGLDVIEEVPPPKPATAGPPPDFRD